GPLRRDQHGSRHRHAHAVQSRPQPRRAHPERAVRLLRTEDGRRRTDGAISRLLSVLRHPSSAVRILNRALTANLYDLRWMGALASAAPETAWSASISTACAFWSSTTTRTC